MRGAKILWATALLAITLAGGAGQARACVDGSNMRYYFFRERPEGVRDVIQVRIVSIDGARVEASLSRPFARALGERHVVIELPEYPQGGNCIEYGETEGSVFVPVSSLGRRNGAALFYAVPTPAQPARPQRSLTEIDHYIVDPAMKKAAEESRRP
jgi:hypothetical protein